NRLDLASSSKNELSEWVNRFYEEDPRRKAAWEIFKLEQGNDGSQSDPSWVPVGIGEAYLQKAASLCRKGPHAQERVGCLSWVAAIFALVTVLTVIIFKSLKP